MNELAIHQPNNLRIIRKQLELSQKGFAELMKLSRSKINSYERGVEPRLQVLAHIAGELRVSIDVLVFDDWNKYSLFKIRQMLFPNRVMSRLN